MVNQPQGWAPAQAGGRHAGPGGEPDDSREHEPGHGGQSTPPSAAQGSGRPRTPPASVRIDKWLWAVRLYKTRTVAADACRAGHVRLNGHPAKPSREVHVGDTLTARTGHIQRTIRVRALLENRVGAALVREFIDDLTPPEEFRKTREPVASSTAWRRPGAGRPTKRERRQMDAWLRRSGE